MRLSVFSMFCSRSADKAVFLAISDCCNNCSRITLVCSPWLMMKALSLPAITPPVSSLIEVTAPVSGSLAVSSTSLIQSPTASNPALNFSPAAFAWRSNSFFSSSDSTPSSIAFPRYSTASLIPLARKFRLRASTTAFLSTFFVVSPKAFAASSPEQYASTIASANSSMALFTSVPANVSIICLSKSSIC